MRKNSNALTKMPITIKIRKDQMKGVRGSYVIKPGGEEEFILPITGSKSN